MYGNRRAEQAGASRGTGAGREICPNLSCDHGKYLDLLESVARVQGVKHVFVGSGIRYDLLMTQPDAVLEKVIKRFVGGQMKVAPEHASQKVLELMNKPSWSKYERFRDRFYRITSRLGLKRHVIPYLITSHPGATLEDEKELLEKLEEDGFVPDQVQDFIPLPMTRAGVMYHTRIDPHSNKRVFVAHDRSEKERHFALLRPKQAKYRKLRQKLLGDNKEQRRPPRKRGRRRKPLTKYFSGRYNAPKQGEVNDDL
ncbi:MAG: DUF3362 domain-containing protein [Planctomycetota bacterium]|nr:DUF3362 domain-containing protein [Planctomycetota bacterium]